MRGKKMETDKRLKQLRSECGLSQNKFAKLFHMSARTLQHWEQGERKPPEYIVDMMEKIIDMERSPGLKVFVCLDNHSGITFHGKRQSKDVIVREVMRIMAQDSPVFMSKYSKEQFEEDEERESVCVYKDISKIPNNAYCFVESKTDFDAVAEKAREIIVFNWNRRYPSDETVLVPNQYVLTNTYTLIGNSHDLITVQKYKFQNKK